MLDIPESIDNTNNLEVLRYLENLSCHGDIVLPTEKILRPLDDVKAFVPDAKNFSFVCWYSNNVVFAFGTGMHEIGIRLPHQESEKDKCLGQFEGEFDGNQWWSVEYNSLTLDHWVLQAYEHARDS